MEKMCALLYSRKNILPFQVQSLGIVFLVLVSPILVTSELFTSQSDLESLIYLRREVRGAINLYIRREEERIHYLKERLKASRGFSSVKLDSNNKGGSGNNPAIASGSGSGNPINAFLLVKALTLDLSELITITGDRENFREFAKTVEDLNTEITFPSGEDISGAALGLIRLQDTYQLDTKAIANGALGDSCCAPQLSVEDCFELGRQSYHAKNYEYAIQWLSEALLRFSALEMVDDHNHTSNAHVQVNSTKSSTPEPSDAVNTKPLPVGLVSKSEILDYLQWAQNIKKTVEVGKDFLSQMTGIELDAFVEEVAQVMVGQKDRLTQKELTSRYKLLCRGTNSLEGSVGSANPKLKCQYSSRGNNPYYWIGPVKEEQINLDPPMWSFKQVIYDGEIEALKMLARPKFETAMIVNVVTGINERSDTRISKSAWLGDYDGSVVKRINERIGRVTGLNMDSAEMLQVANYGIGGMYLPHYDFAQPGQSANFIVNDGNRVATLLFYMSDVEKGGATVFPKLNLTIWPEKGSAVFWFNLKRNGECDMNTQHAACPVLVGSKWVSNKWIHERGQEFRYQCGLTPNE